MSVIDLQLYRPFAREDRLTAMTQEKFHAAVERALLELVDELSDAVRKIKFKYVKVLSYILNIIGYP